MIRFISPCRYTLRKAQFIKLQKPTDQADRCCPLINSSRCASSKEVRHWLRRSSSSGTGCKSKRVAYSPQQILVVVERLRFEIALYLGADYESCNTASAISGN